jgi:hypothetical protein
MIAVNNFEPSTHSCNFETTINTIVFIFLFILLSYSCLDRFSFDPPLQFPRNNYKKKGITTPTTKITMINFTLYQPQSQLVLSLFG